jgi:hypothetical protein
VNRSFETVWARDSGQQQATTVRGVTTVTSGDSRIKVLKSRIATFASSTGAAVAYLALPIVAIYVWYLDPPSVKDVVVAVLVLGAYAFWWWVRELRRLEKQITARFDALTLTSSSDSELAARAAGKAPGRYDAIDVYTLEELLQDYRAANASGRIRLLQQLQSQGWRLPFELALMATEDSDVTVRRWIARHGNGLDYREQKPGGGQKPERNLEQWLSEDRDSFVRASLRENPHVYGWRELNSTKVFMETNHLERLALMRNSEQRYSWFRGSPVQQIFDPEDQQLGISLQEREELILAYVSNPATVEASHRNIDSFDYGGSWEDNRKHLSKLWELASKWPVGRGPWRVYRYLGVDPRVRANTYRLCPDPLLRDAILEGCNPARDQRTLRLGLRDPDATCRDTANELCNQLGYIKRLVWGLF